jgi:hypothetical protein
MLQALQFCKTNESHGIEVPNMLLCNLVDFELILEELHRA